MTEKKRNCVKWITLSIIENHLNQLVNDSITGWLLGSSVLQMSEACNIACCQYYPNYYHNSLLV